MTETIGSAIDLHNWHRDVTEAEKLGISVEQYQTMRRLEKLADKVLGPAEEDPDIIKARQALEKKEREVRAKEEERFAAVREWESLCAEIENIRVQRQCGEYMAECAEQERADCEETVRRILNKSHPLPAANEFPNTIMEVGRRLAGAKEVLAIVPAWREAINTREAANDAALVKFAKEHGITEKLPAHLQERAK